MFTLLSHHIIHYYQKNKFMQKQDIYIMGRVYFYIKKGILLAFFLKKKTEEEMELCFTKKGGKKKEEIISFRLSKNKNNDVATEKSLYKISWSSALRVRRKFLVCEVVERLYVLLIIYNPKSLTRLVLIKLLLSPLQQASMFVCFCLGIWHFKGKLYLFVKVVLFISILK